MEETKEKKRAVKIILLGDSAVGKSKLVERYLLDNYHPMQHSTYALTLFNHEAVVDGEAIDVTIWDTAGQERFSTLHPSYFHRAHACVMVFDVTRKITYKNMERWWEELQEFRKDIPTIVVANKIDLDPECTKRIFNFAEQRNLPFYFASSSDGTNVVRIFNEAIRQAVHCLENPPPDFYNDVMGLLDEEGKAEHAEGEK